MYPRPASVPLEEGSSFRESLFAGCDAYASVPATLLYSPNYAPGSGGLSVLGKLPLRLYVGVRESLTGGPLSVRCADTYTFVPEEKAYLRSSREPVPSDLLTSIAALLGVRRSVEITTWSDFPFRRGLNADAAVATAIASALAVIASTDRRQAIRELSLVVSAGKAEGLRWRFGTGPEDALDPDAEFKRQPLAVQVFDAALRLESQLFRAPADGHFILASMLNAERAIVFARKPDPVAATQDRAGSPVDWWFRDGGWWGAQIEDLWPETTSGGLWPVAVALWFVSQGDSSDRGGILREQSFDSHVRPLEYLFSRADRPVYGLAGGGDEPPTRALFNAYRQAFVACSVRVLQTLKRVLTDGSARIAPFCDSQNRCQGLLQLLERSPPAAQRAITDLSAAAASLKPPVSIGCRFQEYGRHGYLLVVGEPVRLREVTDAAAANVNRSAAHWNFEPEQLGTQGLDVQLGHSDTVDIRILRGGKWERDASMPRAHLASQRFHLLVRIDPLAADGQLAWCRKANGLPGSHGETYDVLSKAMATKEMPNGQDIAELKLVSLPTLGLLIASLSEKSSDTVSMAETTKDSYQIPVDSRRSDAKAFDRDRTSIKNALDSGNRLLQAMSGAQLRGNRKKKTKGSKYLTFFINPDDALVIGVEFARSQLTHASGQGVSDDSR